MYRDADSFPVVSLFSNTSIVSLRHITKTLSKGCLRKAVKKSNEALVYGLKVRFSFSKLGRLFFYRPSKAPLESLQYFSI